MINESRWAGRWAAVGILLLVGLFQAGCKTGASGSSYAEAPDSGGTRFASAAPVGDSNAPGAQRPGDVGLDSLRVGDTVTIELSDMPIPFPPREERIKEDGTIMLLEGKSFTAAGKTRGQLETEIHDCYVPKYYLKMTVSVSQKTQTQFYYVRGEVKQPTRQIYISRITVLKAIASAGDFTDFARKSAVLLTRSDGRKITINAKKALKNPKLDLEVLPGDDIYVPRRIL